MKRGHLSEYFTGLAAKRLSAVEVDISRSNQHEFNGVDALKRLFGTATGTQRFPARFIYLSDDQDQPTIADGSLSWYDARERHPTRSEHRLYFAANSASDCAAKDDVLVIARRPDGSVLVVIAREGSTIASQVHWLFGLTDLAKPGFAVRDDLETDRDRLAFASRLILENIGIDVAPPTDSHLEDMLARFSGGFPSTRDFSSYARSTVRDVGISDSPDDVLMVWMEREELLFRTLERHVIGDRLKRGFQGDVDGFIAFSLSVQNRRKSRVGHALENHLESTFKASYLRYSRAALTENRSRPDFLFPGATEYRDQAFNPLRLTMLGVKSSCKDRWRQVLTEARRVERKHLLTLESAISGNQTDQMRAEKLQLVVPRQLHASFTEDQQRWLMDLTDFIALARERQG
ncbi:MAG: restriction endonuclease [Gammaproteobacteria bacterium]|nr:restriction endonuclease [Gammaproteobacteria bacterium]